MISGMPIIWRQDLSFGRWKIMELGQSLEDYLEAAYRLSKNQDVRNIDIALLLGRSKPSVSVAVKELMEKGYCKKG